MLLGECQKKIRCPKKILKILNIDISIIIKMFLEDSQIPKSYKIATMSFLKYKDKNCTTKFQECQLIK